MAKVGPGCRQTVYDRVFVIPGDNDSGDHSSDLDWRTNTACVLDFDYKVSLICGKVLKHCGTRQ